MDIKTMIGMLVIGNLIILFMLLFYIKGNAEQAIRFQVKCQILFALAYPMLILRDIIPLKVSAVLGNSLLIIGTVYQVLAIFSLLNILTHRIMRLHIYFILSEIIFFLLNAILYDDTNARIIIITSATVMLLVYPSFALLKDKTKSKLQTTIGIMLLIDMLCFITRIIYAIRYESQMNLYSKNIGQTLTFVALYVFMIVGGYGFILLLKEKDDMKLLMTATTDELTSILNRSAFIDKVSKSIDFCHRKKLSYSFLMMDLDQFKMINDKYGHLMGDKVLKNFAFIINRELRSYDLFGRFGGDEFGIFLQSVNYDETVQIGKRICSVMENNCLDGIKYTVSIGIINVDVHEISNTDFFELYHIADKALYESKNSGRSKATIAKYNS